MTDGLVRNLFVKVTCQRSGRDIGDLLNRLLYVEFLKVNIYILMHFVHGEVHIMQKVVGRQIVFKDQFVTGIFITRRFYPVQNIINTDGLICYNIKMEKFNVL